MEGCRPWRRPIPIRNNPKLFTLDRQTIRARSKRCVLLSREGQDRWDGSARMRPRDCVCWRQVSGCDAWRCGVVGRVFTAQGFREQRPKQRVFGDEPRRTRRTAEQQNRTGARVDARAVKKDISGYLAGVLVAGMAVMRAGWRTSPSLQLHCLSQTRAYFFIARDQAPISRRVSGCLLLAADCKCCSSNTSCALYDSRKCERLATIPPEFNLAPKPHLLIKCQPQPKIPRASNILVPATVAPDFNT